MTYSIALAPPAARQLPKFDPQVRRRIQAALELLATEPRPPAATRLVGGSGEWRVRTGGYRIIYEIEGDRLLILVLRVGPDPIGAATVSGRAPGGDPSGPSRPSSLEGPVAHYVAHKREKRCSAG
jgi:mRNA interferase RelE/StbE